MPLKVCDFIEAKKEERRKYERDAARGQKTTPKPAPTGQNNLLGYGSLHVGGHS